MGAKPLRNYISQITFYIGLFVLTFIFNNILLTSILFILKVSVQASTFYASLLVSILSLYILMRKKGMSDLKRKYFIVLFVSLISIMGSMLIQGKVYDRTFDGNTYQKGTIGELKEGWNPVYTNVNDFDDSLNFLDYIWIDSYAKGSHFFGANVYKVSHNIECAKSINLLSIIILFFLILSFLLEQGINVYLALLFSLASISFSVVTNQLFTNYIDILVYLYFAILIYCFFLFESKTTFISLFEKFIVYSITLALIINVKFSAFGFAGIYCFGYFIYYIARFLNKKIDKKFLITFVSVSAISVLYAVFVIGLSTYPKNILKHGHPFYPIMGKDKIDIMTTNSPSSFQGKSAVEKFIISNFSRADNIYSSVERSPELKIPFTFQKKELYSLIHADTRISGGGILFGGILLISTIVYVVSASKLWKINKKAFFLIYIFAFITVLFAVLLDESWWVRYFPQEYVYVLLSFVTLYCSHPSRVGKYIGIVLISLLLINNSVNLGISTVYSIQKNKEMIASSEKLKYSCSSCPRKICINPASFVGVVYNIKDENKDIIIFKEKPYLNKYKNKYLGYIEWRCCR